MAHYERSRNYVRMATNGILVMQKQCSKVQSWQRVLFERTKFNYQVSYTKYELVRQNMG